MSVHVSEISVVVRFFVKISERDDFFMQAPGTRTLNSSSRTRKKMTRSLSSAKCRQRRRTRCLA